MTNSAVVSDTRQQPQVVIRPTLPIPSSQTVPMDKSVSPIVNPTNVGVNQLKKQPRGFKTHHNTKSESNFELVKSKKQKQDKRTHVNKRKHIVGSADKESCLSVVEKQKYLFVSRLSTSVNSESLNKYLCNKHSGNYVVTQLKNKYPGFRSFKVDVPASIWSDVYAADFWHSGVFVSQFRFSCDHSKGSNKPNSFLEKGLSQGVTS